MDEVNEMIQEIEKSNFTVSHATRLEANALSQQLGGRTIPRNADPVVANMYVTLLMLRKLAQAKESVDVGAAGLLAKHGICEECGELFEHHYDEPFATCSCCTAEWYKLTPHMEVVRLLRDKLGAFHGLLELPMNDAIDGLVALVEEGGAS